MTTLPAITKTSTLAELQAQLALHGISAFRLCAVLNGGFTARMQHPWGLFEGRGPTVEAAIRKAFAEIRVASESVQ